MAIMRMNWIINLPGNHPLVTIGHMTTSFCYHINYSRPRRFSGKTTGAEFEVQGSARWMVLNRYCCLKLVHENQLILKCERLCSGCNIK